MSKFEKVFIVHYKENQNRKDYLLSIPFLSAENVVWNTSFQSPEELPDIKYKILPKEACVFLAHREILESVLENGYKSFLILEDDALVGDLKDPEEFFSRACREFEESDADIAFLAQVPDNWHCKINNTREDQVLYHNVRKCSLATHCYTIKTDKIPFILENLTLDLPIDHEYTRLIEKLKLKVAWSFPGVRQGTHTNIYKSNIR